MLMDVEINKLEKEIAQACRVNKLRMTGQDMGNQTTTLEDCQEFVALLPWLQPNLIKRSKQESAPYKEEREALNGARVTKGDPQTGLKGDLKPRTMGATT